MATLLLGGLISGTHPRISMFFAGMLLWEWFTHRWPARRDLPGRAGRHDRAGLTAAATALAVGLVVPSGLLQGLLRIAVVLVAWPVLCAACFGPDGRAGWALFGLLPVTFTLSVAGSLALFLVVEKPLSLDRREVFGRPGAAPPSG